MKQHQSLARRCAAVVTTAALVVGASSLLAPAEAKAKKKPLKGNVSGTVMLDCLVPAFDAPFEYEAQIKLTGKRAKKSTKKATLQATFSDMPPVAPVPMNNLEMSATLKLTAGGTKATLKGKKAVSAESGAPVPVPPVKGSVNNKSNSLPIVISSLDLEVMGIEINCVPAESGALGTLKLK